MFTTYTPSKRNSTHNFTIPPREKKMQNTRRRAISVSGFCPREARDFALGGVGGIRWDTGERRISSLATKEAKASSPEHDPKTQIS